MPKRLVEALVENKCKLSQFFAEGGLHKTPEFKKITFDTPSKVVVNILKEKARDAGLNYNDTRELAEHKFEVLPPSHGKFKFDEFVRELDKAIKDRRIEELHKGA